jgi:peptidoglycan/xylan/chitin deacetylase (PgdA/CDA1 family)
LFFLKLKKLVFNRIGIKVKPLCIIVYYHSIYPEEVKSFERQMSLLKNNFKVLKSDYFGKLQSDKKYSIITFDDGFENIIYNAVPVLEKNNLPFTIFFISNYFGKIANWEFPENHRDMKQKIMSVEQMKNLPMHLLTIGSHTANHKKLVELSQSELISELEISKRTLENLTNRRVEIISFPNGEYNLEVINKSFEVGYKRVFTIDPKLSLQEESEKVSGRIWVNGNDWYIEFWLKVNGAYNWLNTISKLKRRILR